MVRIHHSTLIQGFWGFAMAVALLFHWNALRATNWIDDVNDLQTTRSSMERNQATSSQKNTTTISWPGQPRSDLSNPKRTPLIRIGGNDENNPVAGSREYLLENLDEFVEVYKNRPDKSNLCGIRINHALMIWMVARRLQPTTIVESGINSGQSTYFFRQACPSVKIISIDPLTKPICGQKERWIDKTNNEYLVGDSFVDFNNVDWGARIKRGDLEPSKTLVFVDDHIGFFTRFPTLVKYGFGHAINEDNYKAGEGVTDGDRSFLAPKQMLRARARHADTVWLFHNLQVYHEFPPLLPPIMSQNATHTKKKEGGLLHHTDDLRFIEEPLLRPDVSPDDKVLFAKIARELNIDANMSDSESYNEWMSYNYIAYMRIVPLAPRLAKEWNLTSS